MLTVLLVIIYIAFIGLGLPDAILGAAWPTMYQEMNVPISNAGIITSLIAVGTVTSSLFSPKIIHYMGTGKVTTISMGLSALALFGFSMSQQFWMLILWAIPFGLAAGSVDAALNNFVALHYKASHMSWLHAFWGVGASCGPLVMGFVLMKGFTWNFGYQTIAILQVLLVICLICSIPLWKKVEKNDEIDSPKALKPYGIMEALRISGVKQAVLAFFCYCAMEFTAGLWISSYMVIQYGITEALAASFGSLFYLGITGGRFICGFLAMKFSDKQLVRMGQAVAMLGVLIVLLPFGYEVGLAGCLLIGMGLAPIFPSLLHATPYHFGKEASQTIIGMQMACSYTGTTLMPLVFGWIAESTTISVLPFYLMFFAVCMICFTEVLFAKVKRAHSAQ